MACHFGHWIICVALSHLMQHQQTALHMACESGHVVVAATLLIHGANVDKKDRVRLLCVYGQHGVMQNGVSGLDMIDPENIL